MNQYPQYDLKQKSISDTKQPLSSIKLLIENLEEIQKKEKQTKTSSVYINKMIKSAAFLYEKIRSTIDFKEEHLLRRGAIQRIITRRIKYHQENNAISKNLIQELIQAGYIKNDLMNTKNIKKIDFIIKKYLKLIGFYINPDEQSYFLSIASAEIEESLVSHASEEALVHAMHTNIYKDIQKKINKIDSVQLSLTLRSVFLKSDLATLRFYLWKKHYPSWVDISPDFLDMMINKNKISDVVKKIETDLKNPLNKKLTKQVKLYNPIFIVMQKMISEDTKKLKEVFSHPQGLVNESRMVIEEYHAGIQAKLKRSILRAVLFILITKIALGFLIEIPYDMYFFEQINWLPLAINLVFPPLLMFVSASLVSIPGEKNTIQLIEEIKHSVYGREKINIVEDDVKFSASAPMNMTLKIIYTSLFVIIFGLIIWLLVSLQFNLVSGFLFFFFLSVVSFLAFRIRQSAKDLLVIREREDFISNTLDFLLLPFLRIGHWMTIKFEGINVFLFFLDFIIEAPFKLVLEVLGHWMDFVKEQKEELIN